MAAIQPHPVILTTATKLPPPSHGRTFSKSRSPSRSPSRKAQFAAKELDPLLKNLSPDSTLEALQETNAIGGTQAEHNAIAKSITDATETERELGIRAAIAAKKLREWTDEVTAWPWPNSRHRRNGAGFLPPSTNEQGAPIYFGSLRKDEVKQKEDRLDEIWDAIETLGMDDIKEYVFSSHRPIRSVSREHTSGYGRLRDFTALITATVIQALPVLANLHILLETWSVRLTVSRQIPDLLSALEQVKLALGTINDIVQDPLKSCKLTKGELETGKVIFGNKVSNLGKRVDNLLDLLEGQEDSLPQTWIESLENIENKYAQWVVQAEDVVLKNQMVAERPSSQRGTPITSPTKVPLPPSPSHAQENSIHGTSQAQRTTNSSSQGVNVIKRKPLLEINPRLEPGHAGHRRGISEVSAADSMLSGYSLEDAEIIEAQATPVMPSPRISVIHNPDPNKGVVDSWMFNKRNDIQLSPPRPSFISRASAASIEVVPKEQIRKVMMRKSTSYDMLTALPSQSKDSAQTSALTSPQCELDDPTLQIRYMTPLAGSPSPSLRVDPLAVKGRELGDVRSLAPPLVPRRSSKRLSMPLLSSPVRPLTPPRNASPVELDAVTTSRPAQPITPPDKVHKEETFDDKLKSILASMPAKIKLASSSESGSSGTDSTTSSRASSPTRALKLSPVKDPKTGRNGPAASGIRVYTLKGGKSRDAPPIKLYVRAVGEHGERVMVRVGGGWADLAEYLREYSLHHRSRGLAERKLEVAGFPGAQKSQGSAGSTGLVMMPRGPKPIVADQEFDFGLDDNGRPKSAEKKELQTNPWRPPPMPIGSHPDVAMARSTTPIHQNKVRPGTPTSQIRTRPTTPASGARPSSRISVTTTTTPMTVTTTTASPTTYTPLGGAGPVANSRRAASQTCGRSPTSEAWVEGVVNQARAVSGSHTPHTHQHLHPPSITSTTRTTVVQSPITTTTTSIVSSRKGGGANTARRYSSWSTMPSITTTPSPSVRPPAVSSSQGSQMSNTSSSSGTSGDIGKAERRRSRMSLGDVGESGGCSSGRKVIGDVPLLWT